MELRSRSRSKTPLLQQSEAFLEGESFAGSNHVTVTRSRKITTVRSTASSGGITSSTEHHLSNKPSFVKSNNVGVKGMRSSKNFTSSATVKTSDYSSEEGEVEVCHLSQNEKNQILEDARAAANGSAEISALGLYRRAGRYWDKYPKTDYTYSPHSRDRVEIAPGVVQMPNMSRPTIHSSTNTDSSWDQYDEYAARQKLFTSTSSYSANNNAEYEDEFDGSFKIYRSSATFRTTVISRITSVFTSIYSVVYWCFYSVHRAHNSSFIWLGKKLHRLASWLMLLDTWLLRKTPGNKGTRAVVALCLLPLLLFAGWWLLSSLGSAIYWSLLNPSNQPVVPPLVTPTHTPKTEEHHIEPPSNFVVDTDEIVHKILESPQILNIINNYQSNINNADDNERLWRIINALRAEIERVRAEMSIVTQRISRCCNRPIINLKPFVVNVFEKLLNDPEFLANQKGFSDYLHGLFIAKQELEWRLLNITDNLPKDFDVSIEDTANRVMEKITARIKFDPGSISEEKIKEIVRQSLAIYDADKTGLVDYAMEPLGGQVITTRCTETYHAGTAVVSVLGVPLWYPTYSPRVVITPGVNPGECFAFQNFPGFVVIQLAVRIRIEAFSLEHISRLLVPDGKIDSAPKEFEVYGLVEENDRDPVKIGAYVYDYDGESIQFFAAQNYGMPFAMVEVRIKSNHGNPNYTCLYRFRVHGKPVHEGT